MLFLLFCCHFGTVRTLARSFLPIKIQCKTSTNLEESFYCNTLLTHGDNFFLKGFYCMFMLSLSEKGAL